MSGKTVFSGNGYAYTYYPVIKPTGKAPLEQHEEEHQTIPATSVFHTLDTDEHVIPHPSGDTTLVEHERLVKMTTLLGEASDMGALSHILLRSNIPHNQYFIQCQDPTKDPHQQYDDMFWVDGLGNLWAHGNISSPTIDAIYDDINEVEEKATDNSADFDNAWDKILENVEGLASGQTTLDEHHVKFGDINTEIAGIKTEIVSIDDFTSNLMSAITGNDGDIANIYNQLTIYGTILNAKTEDATPGTLVFRKPGTGEVVHTVVDCLRLRAGGDFTPGVSGPNIAMLGRGAFNYVPFIENQLAGDPHIIKSHFNNGNENVPVVYRFGVNQQEVGDLNPLGPGDGLEMTDNNNNVLIQVQKDAATIFMKGEKNQGAFFIEVRDNAGNEVFSVNPDGICRCHTIVAEKIKPYGDKFEALKVALLRVDKGSIWLGENTHLSESGARTRLMRRKPAFPKYLQDLSGVGDLPLGTTAATAVLQDWIDLSVAAGGSDDLAVIFDEANETIDFESSTTFNEIVVKPHLKYNVDANGQSTISTSPSGILIEQVGPGQPFLQLRGSETSSGAGLIHFERTVGGQVQTNSTIMAVKPVAGAAPYLAISQPVGDLNLQATSHAGVGGTIELRCDDVSLIANTTLSMGGREVFAELDTLTAADVTLQSNIDAENARIDAILNLSNADLDTMREIEDAFKNADSSIALTVTNLQSGHNTDVSNLQALLAAETATREQRDTNITQAQQIVNGIFTTRHDIAEAKSSYLDPTTQTLLNAEIASRIEQDGIVVNSTLTITNALDGRLDVVEPLVTANTAKRTYPQSEEDKVTANSAKRTYPQSEEDKVTANSAKISYTDASAVSANTAAVALKANIDDPVFTTKITAPIVHASQLMSQGSHLKIGSKDTNDLNIFLNNAETLQLTRSSQEVRYQSNGGTGTHRFMNSVNCNGDVDIAGTYRVSGTQIQTTDLKDVTTTSTELNIIDGDTGGSAPTLVDADRFVCNDDGTMKQVLLSTLKTYIGGGGGYATGLQVTPSNTYYTIPILSTTGTLIVGDGSQTNNPSYFGFTMPDVTTIQNGHRIKIISGMSPSIGAWATFNAHYSSGPAGKDAVWWPSTNTIFNGTAQPYNGNLVGGSWGGASYPGYSNCNLRLNEGGTPGGGTYGGNVFSYTIMFWDHPTYPMWVPVVG